MEVKENVDGVAIPTVEEEAEVKAENKTEVNNKQKKLSARVGSPSRGQQKVTLKWKQKHPKSFAAFVAGIAVGAVAAIGGGTWYGITPDELDADEFMRLLQTSQYSQVLEEVKGGAEKADKWDIAQVSSSTYKDGKLVVTLEGNAKTSKARAIGGVVTSTVSIPTYHKFNTKGVVNKIADNKNEVEVVVSAIPGEGEVPVYDLTFTAAQFTEIRNIIESSENVLEGSTVTDLGAVAYKDGKLTFHFVGKNKDDKELIFKFVLNTTNEQPNADEIIAMLKSQTPNIEVVGEQGQEIPNKVEINLSDAEIQDFEIQAAVIGAKGGELVSFSNYALAEDKLTLYFDGVSAYGEAVVFKTEVTVKGETVTNKDVLNAIREQKPGCTVYAMGLSVVKDALNISVQLNAKNAEDEPVTVNASMANVGLSVEMIFDKVANTTTLKCSAIVRQEERLVTKELGKINIEGKISRDEAYKTAFERFIQLYATNAEEEAE